MRDTTAGVIGAAWAWMRWSTTRFLAVTVPVAGFVVWLLLFAPISAVPTDPDAADTAAASTPAATATPRPTPTPSPTRTASPAPSPAPTPTAVGGDVSNMPDPQTDEAVAAATDTAAAFTTAYLDTAVGQDQWLANLTPLTSPTLLDTLTYTDLGRVPVGTAGTPEVVVASASYTETVVPIGERQALTVKVALGVDGWRVVSVLPTQQP